MNKLKVVEQLIAQVEAQKQAAEISLRETEASIIDAPGPMQSHSDTTRYQKSLLAGSVAFSLREKLQAVGALRQISAQFTDNYVFKIAPGTLVTLLGTDEIFENYIIVPHCGGIIVETDNDPVISITPESPLAVALIGKERGQSVAISTPKGQRTLLIFDLY